MILERSYLVGLIVGSALTYACESSDEPGYGDAAAPIGMSAMPGAADGSVASSVDGAAAAAPTTGNTADASTASGRLPVADASPTSPRVDSGMATSGSADGGISPDGGGSNDGGAPLATGGTCPGLPTVTDFDQKGPFDVQVKMNVVAGDEGCSLFRPGSSLGKDGLKHPIAVWGNGILTSPDMYTDTLSLFASHGFVVIACNSSGPEQACLNACMDWLVKQNGSGDMAGKLDVTKELTLGYSWGGGAAIDTSTRPNVKASVSFHGMPPRNDPWAKMTAPLLLFTSNGDDFVSASGYVTPNYNSSKVPTFYATLQEAVDHLYILDASGKAAKERGPAIAWMRYWACGDENAKKYFFGADCTLCKAPFKSQSKPMEAFK